MASIFPGECIKKQFFLLRPSKISTVDVNIPVNPFPGCCNDFVIKVLADGGNNTTQNDTNTVIYWFDETVDSASMKLQQWQSGVWVDVATISDDTYGKYGAYGYYTNREGEKFISLEISWKKVYNTIGTGSYKIITSYHSQLGGDQTIESYEYCLRQYSPQLADGTVRLEYTLSGQTGDIADDTKIKDYGTLKVYNTLRVNGYFGYPKASYKEETVEYNNGQNLFVEDMQDPIFKLKLKLLPFFIHEIIRTDFMMADLMAVTDYNARNNGRFVSKLLRKDSGYEPNWYELGGNLASVELQFKPQFNRFRKFR